MGRTSTARKSRPRDAATKIAEQRLSVLELARLEHRAILESLDEIEAA